jgi:anti-sigma-K factor RskA
LDIQQYIASGIVEQYVLGMASAEEAAEFERLCLQYPELINARIEFELSLEDKALAGAIPPPSGLKEKVLDSVSQESILRSVKQILHSENPKGVVRKLPTMKWAIAVCIVLLLGFITFIYILYNRNQQLQTDIAQTRQKLNDIDQKRQAFEETVLPNSSVAKPVKVIVPDAVPATINVFWDSTNKHVYLVIRDLTPLPTTEKYQLWSITKGKSTSMGLFDAPTDEKLILRLNNAQDAEAFAISIAKARINSLVDSAGDKK